MKDEVATFAAGCFWGVEASFEKVGGVMDTTVGYTGGKTKDPTYEEVCSKKTGHAEAIKIVFDPKIVSYKEVLEVFWQIHDPTTKDRQGLNIGTNYRSAIFYHSEKQKKEAIMSRNERQKFLKKKIVTEIAKAVTFYPAEEYHQDYGDKHGFGFC